MIVGYELGLSGVTTPGAGAAAGEFQSNGTRLPRVREISVASQSATAWRFQIGRPGNTPTGGSVTVGGAQNPADAAATAGITTTWTVAPTAPAPGFRQFDFNNVPGSAVIWTLPADGEYIVAAARSGSLVVWSLTAGPTPDLSAVWGE